MNSNYEKYFVIGCNKTATCTFHSIFLQNKLSSQHTSVWQTDKYQCFSDNGDLNDFENLDKNYKNAIFILNVRTLDKWIISRFKHGLANKKKWAYPYTKEKCEGWAKKREEFHLSVLEYFEDRPEKLIIIDIENDNWEEYLCSQLNFEIRNRTINNKRSINLKNQDHVNIINLVNSTLDNLNINKEAKVIQDENLLNYYLKIYKNNLLNN